MYPHEEQFSQRKRPGKKCLVNICNSMFTFFLIGRIIYEKLFFAMHRGRIYIIFRSDLVAGITRSKGIDIFCLLFIIYIL